MNKKVIVRQIDELLKPLGLVRRGSVWNGCTNNIVKVIDVQVSKIDDSITLNVGVLDPEVFWILWGKEPEPVVQVPSCTVHTRIGTLIDDRDVWWPLSDPETARRINEATAKYILPFVQKMCSREQMMGWLSSKKILRRRDPPSMLSLAIIQHLLGKESEARSTLEEQQKKALGAWREGAAEVAGRLGYSVNPHDANLKV